MKTPLVIGVCGGSASGKSRLAHYLKTRLGRRASVFCMDWYYRDRGGLPPEKASKVNFDHPSAIETPLLLSHLKRLLAGDAVDAPIYDYATSSRLKQTRRVQPAPVIIIDGIFSLCEPRVQKLLDLSVYIDVPSDVRLVRRIRRDLRERRVPIEETLRLYESCVRPMHMKFIGPGAAKATFRWHQLDDSGFRQRLFDGIKRRLGDGAE